MSEFTYKRMDGRDLSADDIKRIIKERNIRFIKLLKQAHHQALAPIFAEVFQVFPTGNGRNQPADGADNHVLHGVAHAGQRNLLRICAKQGHAILPNLPQHRAGHGKHPRIRRGIERVPPV